MSGKVLFPNIRAELARTGKTLKDFGDVLGLAPSSVSDRLNGVVEFDLTEIKKTCEYFGKSFNELFL